MIAAWEVAMKAICLIGGAALLLASPAAAQRATSAYTPLDPDRCQVIERIEEGASVRWRCPGCAGVPLFLNTGDDRFDLDAGHGQWRSGNRSTRSTSLGPNVEWRLHGGRPVAIIYRLTPSPEAGSARRC